MDSARLVTEIRASSRDLVRRLGFMNRGVAGTDMSPSSVHAIIEIGRTGGLSSRELCHLLLLEKSTVSRLVGGLVERGEISERRSETDGRVKHLRLTARGRRTLAGIDKVANAQVGGALQRLGRQAQSNVLNGLRDYANALASSSGEPAPLATIQEGYCVGLIGRVADMTVRHMHAHVGFGAAFEARVASEMSAFVSRMDLDRDGLWHAAADGRAVGSIAIDSHLGEGRAHLRWFVVDEGLRSAGIGRDLLDRAVRFCDERNYAETHLWTVKGLDAARTLYERHGFELVEEYVGDQWGAEAVEQRFVRRAPLGSQPAA